MMTDDRPSPEELVEAEALAGQLEGDADPTAPRDAGEAAALLSLDAAALSPEREAAVWDRIQSGLPERETHSRPSWRRWLLPFGSLAAASAAVVLVMVWTAAPEPTRLPPPTAGLLQNQARAASGERLAAARLEAGMRTYRREVYAELSKRYGGRS